MHWRFGEVPLHGGLSEAAAKRLLQGATSQHLSQDNELLDSLPVVLLILLLLLLSLLRNYPCSHGGSLECRR